jgi:hypothetical protein
MSIDTAVNPDTAVRPFHVDIPEAAVVDLRRRIERGGRPSTSLEPTSTPPPTSRCKGDDRTRCALHRRHGRSRVRQCHAQLSS